MSKAVVDPMELRRFAQHLKRFNQELLNQLNVLRGQMTTLAQTWRDQEHDKFVEEFDQTMLQLSRFTEASEQHIPFLMRKAEKIEEYLHQR